MDLHQLKRQFLEYCELEKGQSMLTINSYSRYLDRFLDFLEEQKRTKVEELKTKDIKSFDVSHLSLVLCPSDITQEVVREYRLYVNRLHDQNGAELKRSTQNYHILALRSFLRYLAWRGITSLAPEKVPVAKAEDRKINFLEAAEIKNIFDLPSTGSDSESRDRAILELFFSTGLRVSELAALDVDEVNFDRGEIAVLGKGKKMRLVFLSKQAVNLLSQYLAERGIDPNTTSKPKGEPLFLSNRETRLTVRSIERLVKKYARLAGITKNVSPHTLRHSFATDLLMAGADIRSVQSMLGHSSISTTQIYTHVTDQHLRDTHQKFHGKSLKEEEDKSNIV